MRNKSTTGFRLALGVLLICIAVPAHPRTAARLPDSIPVWYCQIGRWYFVNDSAAGTAYLAHDAARDGARSGQTTSNAKLNFALQHIRTINARMTFARAPACAGIFAKNKLVTVQFLVSRNPRGDSLRVLRAENNRESLLLAAPVTSAGDSVNVQVRANGDRLDVIVNREKISITLPPEFSDLAFVGFVCPLGSVRVHYVHVEAANRTFDNALKNAQFLNLQMEKMFGASSGKTR